MISRDVVEFIGAVGLAAICFAVLGSPSWRDDGHAQLDVCEARWEACEHKLTETAAYRDKLVAYCRPEAARP